MNTSVQPQTSRNTFSQNPFFQALSSKNVSTPQQISLNPNLLSQQAQPMQMPMSQMPMQQALPQLQMQQSLPQLQMQQALPQYNITQAPSMQAPQQDLQYMQQQAPSMQAPQTQPMPPQYIPQMQIPVPQIFKSKSKKSSAVVVPVPSSNRIELTDSQREELEERLTEISQYGAGTAAVLIAIP